MEIKVKTNCLYKGREFFAGKTVKVPDDIGELLLKSGIAVKPDSETDSESEKAPEVKETAAATTESTAESTEDPAASALDAITAAAQEGQVAAKSKKAKA